MLVSPMSEHAVVPKKVLLLQSAIGGAHHSVANAIALTLDRIYPGQFECKIVDVFASHSRFPLGAIVNLYPHFLIHHPLLWKLVYYGTCGRRRLETIERIAEPLIRPNLEELFSEENADVIVSVVHSIGNLITKALMNLKRETPVIVVVVDLASIHPAWAAPGAQWYVVPSEAAKEACIGYGVMAKSIQVYGLPVSPEFCKVGTGKAEIRGKLGLVPDLFTTLILGGGEGAGGILAIAQALSRAALPIQMILVCGRNCRLRNRLQQIQFEIPVKIVGFVSNMPELMQAADVAITKAGPSTIAEAINCGLPMIISSVIPGQEEGNVDYILQHNVGKVAHSLRELVAMLDRLIADPHEYELLVRHTEPLCKMNSSERTAEL